MVIGEPEKRIKERGGREKDIHGDTKTLAPGSERS